MTSKRAWLTAAFVALAVTSCSSSPGTTSHVSQRLPGITYDKAGSTVPWPWTVDTLTVVCSDLVGSAHTNVGGTTYGLSGNDALYATTRGYKQDTGLMTRPSLWSKARPFESLVEQDCRSAYSTTPGCHRICPLMGHSVGGPGDELVN